MGRAKHPFFFRAVAGLEKHVAHDLVTSALLPNVWRLQRWHEQFERARAVHFLADDLLDLSQRAQSERQKRVKPAREVANQSRSQQQLVRDNLRFSGSFFEGGNQGLGPAHK